ncbi:MAG: hypothetical protein JWN41_153 [Thermoleophilia bacterium]|nr:hypothetical protein [Thermoleophilia bacterium]
MRTVNVEDAKAIMWLGLALLFAAAGLATAYLLWRTGRAVRILERDLHRTVDAVVPIIVKTGVGVDQVNHQLAKVDVMLDSAVDMTDALDTSVRAVTHAVTEPVRAMSGAVTGAAEAARSFRDRMAADAPGTDRDSDGTDGADVRDDPAIDDDLGEDFV